VGKRVFISRKITPHAQLPRTIQYVYQWIANPGKQENREYPEKK
jgi:hypothetical protein